MPMYNLLDYRENCSLASESLWYCYRVEIDYFDDNTSEGKSFNYQKK